MREHVHTASRRRDQRLALIRKITLWVSAGAAAASLGFGTAFAHAFPGHAASTTPAPSATPSAPASSGPAGSGSGSAGSAPASSGSASPTASKPAQLSQPQQQPTHTAAPPTVTSGGS